MQYDCESLCEHLQLFGVPGIGDLKRFFGLFTCDNLWTYRKLDLVDGVNNRSY